MDFVMAPERLLLPILMIEWSINNYQAIYSYMLNKNARNCKKWKSIILQLASMIIPAPHH